MTTLMISNLVTGLDALAGKEQVSARKINDELIPIANLTREKTLDWGDFFILLDEADSRFHEVDQDNAKNILREFFGFPKENPEGVALSFTTVRTNSGMIAATKITPEINPAEPIPEEPKSPIVFATGIFHRSSVYLNFLSELAKKTGREVLVYDSPGVGASQVHKGKISHSILAESLPAVIETVYPGQKVSVMGHSLGSIAVRDLYFHQDRLPGNEIEKFVLAMPVPAKEEQHNGLRFSLKYMMGGTVSMFTDLFNMAPNKGDKKHYYQEHSDDEWNDIFDGIKEDRFPVGPFKYLGILKTVGQESVMDYLDDEDGKVEMVLAEKDQVMRCKDVDAWEDRGATILRSADHSVIAGDLVPEGYIDQFAEIFNQVNE
jgi:pimeloyl-ACP methyl ester carboxylesterase